MIDGFTVTFAGILQAGAGGIVTIIVLMVLSGRLASRKSLDDQKEVTATAWKAYEASETARRELESLVRENLETSRMVLHLVRSIRGVAAGEDENAVEPPTGRPW